jgi:phage shock protein C
MSKLRKSKDKVLAGVCAGIAEHIGWEASKVRLIYVILSLFSAGFPGLLLYIVLWIAMPD